MGERELKVSLDFLYIFPQLKCRTFIPFLILRKIPTHSKSQLKGYFLVDKKHSFRYLLFISHCLTRKRFLFFQFLILKFPSLQRPLRHSAQT